ncbi:MAG: Ig-like domain-containing protein [Acutalibacteraceae bacterium]
MKKSLASCLTSVALLSSMCFSSPLAQVHAEETTPLTTETELETPATSYTPIELNAQKVSVDVGYTHSLTLTSIDGINVDIPEDEVFDLVYGEKTDEVQKEFTISSKDKSSLTLTGRESGKQYKIELNVKESENSENSEDYGRIYELKLANTSDYNASGVEIGEDTQHFEIGNVSTPVTVTPLSYEMLKIDTTKADLKVGEGFELILPEVIKSKIDPKIFNYSLSGEYYHPTNEPSEHTFTDYITLDDQDHWKGTIKSDEIGGKFKLTATMEKELLAESNGSAETELIDPESIAEETTFKFPIEFTIVDENDTEEENDGNIVFEVSPEYKKLTQKGETYKIETGVSLEENAGADAKELFDAIVADKDNFKVLFKSANPEVATVSEEGVVTAVANGSTEIVAYIEGYEDELFGVSKVDVEIPTEVAETEEEISDASDSSASSSYPKTGENFMAISAAILTLGIAVLAVAFMSKKKDTNEEK